MATPAKTTQDNNIFLSLFICSISFLVRWAIRNRTYAVAAYGISAERTLPSSRVTFTRRHVVHRSLSSSSPTLDSLSIIPISTRAHGRGVFLRNSGSQSPCLFVVALNSSSGGVSLPCGAARRSSACCWDGGRSEARTSVSVSGRCFAFSFVRSARGSIRLDLVKHGLRHIYPHQTQYTQDRSHQ